MYDLSGGQTGANVFTTTTREIAKYIAYTFWGEGELQMAMNPDTLDVEVLVNPEDNPPADGAGATTMEIWKIAINHEAIL